jgi:nucleotide-binding universal stress UspA family protein
MYAHPLAFYDLSDSLKTLGAAVARKASVEPLRVLAAIDGAPGSIAAAEHALELVRSHGGEVVLVNVQPAPAVSDARRTAERALRPAEALLEASGVAWRSQIEFGATAESILRCARRERCGLIILGEGGRRRLSKIVRGGVSSDVRDGAGVPVAIVRRALRQATCWKRPASISRPRSRSGRPPR